MEIAFPAPPAGDRRSVYLLGGENGAGKTSLLLALNLGLYGLDADGIVFHSGRRAPEDVYAAVIAECQNREAAAAGDEELAVTVEVVQGDDRVEVQRQWWVEDGRFVEEDVRLRWNGAAVPSAIPASTADARVATSRDVTDVLLPPEAARFFFFDGEEVAAIAERDLDKSVINGLDDLLGLDRVHGLIRELRRFETRERDKLQAATSSREYPEAHKVLVDAERQHEESTRILEDAQARRLRVEERSDATEAELDALFDGRAVEGIAELRAEHGSVAARLEETARVISRVFADSAGLVVTHDMVEELSRLTGSEDDGRRDEKFSLDVADEVDRVIERVLRARSITVEQRQALRDRASSEIQKLRDDAEVDRNELAGLSDNEVRKLSQKADGLLSGRALRRLRMLLQRKRQLKRDLHRLRLDLERLESSGSATTLIDQKRQAEADLKLAAEEIATADVAARTAEVNAKAARARLDALEETLATSERSAARAAVARHARLGFDRYAKAVRSQRTAELEIAVSETLRRLLHREGALDRVAIDPKTCHVTMFDGRGAEIPVPSAGEREIFALSLIHGLGRLSHRDSPLVIDTPLGRLDVAHRRAIVGDYLPTAAGQVIVLSTDAEIDGQMYDLLRDSIAWQATLSPCADGGVTIDEGRYFDISEAPP